MRRIYQLIKSILVIIEANQRTILAITALSLAHMIAEVAQPCNHNSSSGVKICGSGRKQPQCQSCATDYYNTTCNVYCKQQFGT